MKSCSSETRQGSIEFLHSAERSAFPVPVIRSSYRPPWFLRNGHLQTIYPILFRPRPKVSYDRERLETPDEDFFDLDWSRVGSNRVALICHGLEGCSVGIHELGMVTALNASRWDAVVLNFRGCSGELNRTLRFYHSGETGDLRFAISHIVRAYPEVALIGFSLGGNVILTYLGQDAGSVAPAVRCAAVFSVPCDLAASARKLERLPNRIYLRRFLKTLRAKVIRKAPQFPNELDITGIERIRTFRAFDDRYTAPIHGFRDAGDYWRRCSSGRYAADIRVPTLLVNARNDPFLPKACFPVARAEANPHLFLEMPTHGGHNGFVALNEENRYWSESRALKFLEESW